MSMKLFGKREIIPIAMILAAAAAGVLAYPHLPIRVPTHWDISGRVNGWSSRAFAAAFSPALTAVVYAILSAVPFFDPKRRNIETFADAYFLFRVCFVAYLVLLHAAILAVGLGYAVPMTTLIMAMMSALFLGIAWLLPKTRRNYTIGIRLPWTLESDAVWDSTHRFGGTVFMAAAAVTAWSGLLPGAWGLLVFLAALSLALAATVVYAYRAHRASVGR